MPSLVRGRSPFDRSSGFQPADRERASRANRGAPKASSLCRRLCSTRETPQRRRTHPLACWSLRLLAGCCSKAAKVPQIHMALRAWSISGHWRSSGTHYTPRSLTEPIVQYTLEPLVYIGPAEGLPKSEWKLKSAKEILALKICDMACGSGAFLVQATRYMAERLMEAWEIAKQANPYTPNITPEGLPSTGGVNESLNRSYCRCIYTTINHLQQPSQRHC
jgi:hypothetical protein